MVDKKQEALDAAIKDIRKSYGAGSIRILSDHSAAEPVEVIGTRNDAINEITGIGGIPRGRITEIYGPEAGGKTTLALQIIAQAQQNSFLWGGEDTGAANAYVTSLSPNPTIIAGSGLYFIAAHANTGASTIAVNGGSATAIKKQGTAALAGGEISAGQIIHLIFDGTNYQMV